MTTVREELAWAAGFFDGEGCCGIRSKSGNLYVHISQNDRKVLDRFKQAVGDVGHVNEFVDNYLNRNGTRFQYQIGSFEGVQAVVVMIWIWLSPIKREQIVKAFNKYYEFRRDKLGLLYGDICKNGHDIKIVGLYTVKNGNKVQKICKECHRNIRKVVKPIINIEDVETGEMIELQL